MCVSMCGCHVCVGKGGVGMERKIGEISIGNAPLVLTLKVIVLKDSRIVYFCVLYQEYEEVKAISHTIIFPQTFFFCGSQHYD